MKRLFSGILFVSIMFIASAAFTHDKVVVVPLGGSSSKTTIPAPLPKTGLTSCYDQDGVPISCIGTGQDGEYQKGVDVTPRFTDNGDGSVTDHLTGLVWLKDGNCTSFYDGDTTSKNDRSWQAALTAANQLADGYCGLSDGSAAGNWRLPNRRELLSLIDDSQFDPALPPGHPFLNTVLNNYWSSTTFASNSASAWVVIFNAGFDYYGPKSSSYYVRAVRDQL